jgi:ceramide glucosyltransferase
LWWIGTYALVWYGAEAVLMRIARWPGSWRDLLALPQRDLLMPAIWLAALLRSDFTWRGTAMGGTGTPLVPLEPGE